MLPTLQSSLGQIHSISQMFLGEDKPCKLAWDVKRKLSTSKTLPPTEKDIILSIPATPFLMERNLTSL